MSKPVEKIRVIIVEDDKEMREGLELIVRSNPALQCIATCSSGEEALESIPANIPDIVLMDIHLPGISGIDCVKKLKPSLAFTQFMMCTVYEDNESVFDSLCAGATGYLLKNSPPTKITEAIMDLYQGGSPMSPVIARKVIQSFKSANVGAGSKPAQTDPEPTPSDLFRLTKRELEMLDLLAKGYRYKEIADQLSISFETVRTHIHNIYEKLHVQSRTEALNKAFPR
ncbi:MAG: response regulator transcription factor [Bacteroidales bacterium]|nr:response regulator transcription factor [Bacteroidales bacterium]